jgi:2-polyprenyl-3-methyl-5-hydroxy-6-metoxy-1,4-benzoquinol methylase
VRVIGTVKMRNEEHILKDTLDIWAEYVDGIYIYDDCSDDNSVEIAMAHPAVIDVIRTGRFDPDRLRAEWQNRQQLLEYAQSHNPEWIAYFDADEHLYEFDKSMFDDPKVHVIATQWHDMYITPEDANLPTERYKERRWCGVEYRQIPFFYRNSPELKYDTPDQRIMHHRKLPFYPVNGVIQHWGKGHSQMIWERKCEYYGNGQDYQGKKGIYAQKWLARKGKAVHENYKSDDGNPLQLWSEIRARYQPSVRSSATRSTGKVDFESDDGIRYADEGIAPKPTASFTKTPFMPPVNEETPIAIAMSNEEHKRLVFKKTYDELFKGEEYKRTDLRPWMKHFKPEIKHFAREGYRELAPPTKILDLGCGTGASLIYYSQRDFDCYGVEIAYSAIETFKHNKPPHLDEDRIWHGFIEDYEPEQKFDYVILAEVLEHVIDPVPVLTKALECLADDGELYISAPCVEDDNPRHLRAVTMQDLQKWMDRFTVFWTEQTENRIYAKATKAKPEMLPQMKGGIDTSKYDEEKKLREFGQELQNPKTYNGDLTPDENIQMPWHHTKVHIERNNPIVCCIPRLNPDPRHLADWELFYAENKEKHNLVPYIMYNRALHHVQREAVQKAMQIGASHILFTESDQHRYPLDGLEVLLEVDKDVIGFRTYERRYPYRNMCFRKAKPEVSMIIPSEEMAEQEAYLFPFGQGDGDVIQKCDLITWAFTLVKVDVFRKMDEAWGNTLVSMHDLRNLLMPDAGDLSEHEKMARLTYTRNKLMECVQKPWGLEPFRQWGPHPTDSFFCQYCEDLGIDRYVHFGATIAHGDVLPDDILMARRLHESQKMSPYQPHTVSMPLEDDFGNVYSPDFEHLPEMAQKDIADDEQAYGGDGTPGPVNKSEDGLRLTGEILQP